jgi:hypothetical protein
MTVLELPLRRFGCEGAIRLLAISSILLLFFGFAFTLAALAFLLGRESSLEFLHLSFQGHVCIGCHNAGGDVCGHLGGTLQVREVVVHEFNNALEGMQGIVTIFEVVLIDYLVYDDVPRQGLSEDVHAFIFEDLMASFLNGEELLPQMRPVAPADFKMSQRKRACWSSFLPNSSWCFSASCHIVCERWP